jgi:hypothetical protein
MNVPEPEGVGPMNLNVRDGMRCAGVPWSDLSRGMHREQSGQSCCYCDEKQMRAFWRQYICR